MRWHAPAGRLGVAFDYALIVVGSVLVAVGTNLFFVPNNVVSGGVTGISIIFHHFWKTPVGAVVFAFNLPLLWLGWRLVLLSAPCLAFRPPWPWPCWCPSPSPWRPPRD